VSVDTVVEERIVPFGQRTVPWAALGTVFDAEGLTTAQMLNYANLSGWNVGVDEIPLPPNYFSTSPLLVTARDSGIAPGVRDVFGVVGERYVPLQNEELFAFGDGLLDEGQWVGAGSFKGGRVVFGTLKLNQGAYVNGTGIEMYLVVATSHDGTLAVSASVTPINPVCLNTLIAAIRGAEQKWTMRHTNTLHGRIEAVRKTLRLSAGYIDLWAEFMAPLAESPISDDEFDRIITENFGPGEDATPNALTRWEKRYVDLTEVWYGPTIKGTPYEGTRFALWNTLNEVHGWGARGRGANGAENVAVARTGLSPVWNAKNDDLLRIAATA
jgi:phage/plasmid-like protein (TIGR03299 family)